ncbi:hypothetical protein CR513_19449, partial [Mucuna pruriens]
MVVLANTYYSLQRYHNSRGGHKDIRWYPKWNERDEVLYLCGGLMSGLYSESTLDSYDNRQTFVHCDTKDLRNRYLINWQGFPENPPSTTIALEGRRWCTADAQTLRFPSIGVCRLYRAITSDNFQLSKSWSYTSSIEGDTLLKLCVPSY